MSNPNPIANGVEHDLGPWQPDGSADTNGTHRASGLNEPADINRNSSRIVSNDFMSDLLDGQQQLITAQHQFLHDNDLVKLAASQQKFIQVQSWVLGRLGVFG